MAKMVPVLRTRTSLPTDRRAEPPRPVNRWRGVQTCLTIIWVLLGLTMLSVGIYVKYHTVQLVPEAAAKDTVNELRPDANAPIESAPSESGGEAQQVLNPTNEAMSAQADPAAAAAEMESQVNAVDGVAQNETFASLAGVQPLADAESQVDQEAGSSQLDQTGAVLPGDVNPGAAVESSPLETPDASLEVQNAQQPEDNPQEPTDSVPAPEKEQHPAPEPAPKKKDDGKQNANAKKTE
mmetsp:Transcript_24895/g.47239  ORF Transcript_24895/g.47239 Transcript_24895/m.47239 type:complete len:238 (+) Transcript_24895:107-820(+)